MTNEADMKPNPYLMRQFGTSFLTPLTSIASNLWISPPSTYQKKIISTIVAAWPHLGGGNDPGSGPLPLHVRFGLGTIKAQEIIDLLSLIEFHAQNSPSYYRPTCFTSCNASYTDTDRPAVLNDLSCYMT